MIMDQDFMNELNSTFSYTKNPLPSFYNTTLKVKIFRHLLDRGFKSWKLAQTFSSVKYSHRLKLLFPTNSNYDD